MIDEIRPEYEGRLMILKGIECDILENAEMDLPDDCWRRPTGSWPVCTMGSVNRVSRLQSGC